MADKPSGSVAVTVIIAVPTATGRKTTTLPGTVAGQVGQATLSSEMPLVKPKAVLADSDRILTLYVISNTLPLKTNPQENPFQWRLDTAA